MLSYAEAKGLDALAMLRAGYCPECGDGPYRVPLMHISHKHGWDPRAVRDAVGALYQESLVDPEYGERRSRLSKDQWTDGCIEGPPTTKGKKIKRSKAAKEVSKRVGARRSAKAARSEMSRRRVEKWRSSQFGSMAELAQDEGTTVSAIRKTLLRAGIQPPARQERGVCSIDWCGRSHVGRGWCNSHYKRWRKYGDPLGGRRLPDDPRGRITKPCSREGCEDDQKARGLCSKHYQREKAEERRQAQPDRTCPVCGDTFTPWSHKRYCSTRCKSAMARRKARGG